MPSPAKTGAPSALSIRGGDRLQVTVYDDNGDIVTRGMATVAFGEHKAIVIDLDPPLEILDDHHYWFWVDRIR